MKAYLKNAWENYADLWRAAWSLKGTAFPAWMSLNLGILLMLLAFIVTAASYGFMGAFLGVVTGAACVLLGIGLSVIAKDLRINGGVKVRKPSNEKQEQTVALETSDAVQLPTTTMLNEQREVVRE